MEKQLQRRLDELKHAFSQGQTVFNELKEKEANTYDRLQRLQGAIQVLEEILAQASAPPAPAQDVVFQDNKDLTPRGNPAVEPHHTGVT